MAEWSDCSARQAEDTEEFFRSLFELSDIRFSDDQRGWVWRGEPKLYESCKATLARTRLENLGGLEPHLIAQFRRRAGEHLNSNELELAKSIWGTLILMQHYRAPTRLIDWTLSPWVAAYFAAASEPEEDGVVYGFRLQAFNVHRSEIPERLGAPHFSPLLKVQSLIKWQEMTYGTSKDPHTEEWLIALSPSRVPSRVAAQQALFTLGQPIELDHSVWLREHLKSEDRRLIPLPAKLKAEILRLLSAMNITSASLFPDIAGVCQSIGEMLSAQIPSVGPVDDWA